MTRIIRLTESDLTRIVKRVIKEQQQVAGTPVEKVSWVPVDVETFTSSANNTWTLYLNRNKSPWTIIPEVVKGSKDVRLRITLKDYRQIFTDVYITCGGSGRQNSLSDQRAVGVIDMNTVNKMVGAGYILQRDSAQTYKGDTLNDGINHAIGRKNIQNYAGTIKTLGDQFCEKVK